MNRKLITEFICLFIGLPIFLSLPIPGWIKISTVLIALVYIILIAHNNGWLSFSAFKPNGHRSKWLWLRLTSFGIISLVLFAIYRPSDLFKPLINNFPLWLFILFIYTILSVLPQEWIYRYFYMRRYNIPLLQGPTGIIINGLVFSLAHLFLMNGIVLFITFIGGCLFFWSYQRSNSLRAVCLEHAFYGLWLFSIGAGEMLAFPS
jgi:hypothetical protein